MHLTRGPRSFGPGDRDEGAADWSLLLQRGFMFACRGSELSAARIERVSSVSNNANLSSDASDRDAAE